MTLLDESVSQLGNGDFALGESGWLVLAHNATGVTWAAGAGGLTVESQDAVGGPSATVTAFSPRRSARPGRWVAEAVVSCQPPMLVDLAVVAGEVVPVPGPAPQPAPYAVAMVGEAPTTLRIERHLSEAAVNVGLRLRAPIGCTLTVSRVDVRGEEEPVAAPLVVGFRGARAPFHDGALVGRGAAHGLEVGIRGEGRGRLTLRAEDRYRGDIISTTQRDVELGREARWHSVEVPTSRCGAFAITAELRSADQVARAVFRYVVDEDDRLLSSPLDSPWALTIDTITLDQGAAVLDLLGVRHVRIYSGFSVYDLPGVLDVRDGGTAQAIVDGLHFIGAAAGSPAAVTARAVADVEPGRPRAGWPAWRVASNVLAEVSDARLQPVPALLEPLAGRTVLAEMSQLDDPAAFSRLVRSVAGATQGRSITWLASNEPDLWNADNTPEKSARHSAVFAEAVRSVDPTAHLVGPALADGWDGGHQGMQGWIWLERWLRAGGAEAVDAVSVHLHMIDEETQTPEREDLESTLFRLRELVRRESSRPLPLWVTEMGWRSEPDVVESAEPGESGPAVSEADQADLLVRAAALAAASGVERFYAFHLTGFRVTGEGHRFAWGLLTGHLGAPKPSFAALRRLIRTTAGLMPAPVLTTSARTRAVPFLSPDAAGQDLHLVWQWSGGPGLWTLQGPPAGVTVLDLMGEASPGDDLRRPQMVMSPASMRVAAQEWLLTRLGPRFNERTSEPSLDLSTSLEDVHVTAT